MKSPFFLFLLLPLAAQAAPNFDRRALELVPRFEMAAERVLNARRNVSDKIGAPVQFAVGMVTDLRPSEGRWDTLEDGTSRWRVRLGSPEAKSLNLELSDVRLPPSASLWLYDAAGQIAQGPYTQREVARSGKLWTAVAPGEEAILEMRVAPQEQAQAQFKIAKVNHGFRDITASGKSGGCNIDVACGEADPYRDELRAAARITIGGQFVCSGQLINNVRQDLTPYFLTANHCQIGNSESLSADSVVVYWNYQTSSCGGTPNGSLDQNQTGSRLIARDAGSDFTLIQLNQTPSASFAVYYNGWNADPRAVPTSGASVHHPQGDEKRISIYSTAARATDVNVEGQTVAAWQVLWSRGVTEPGSSGSGLLDQDRRVTGVLSGGDSSCSNPGGSDFYGRLNVAWTASSTASGQLKAHLDPDNSGRLTMDGRDPTRPVPSMARADSGSGVLLGGGGAMGLLPLLGLLLLAGLRRR